MSFTSKNSATISPLFHFERSLQAKIAGRFWRTNQKRTGNCECTRARGMTQEKVFEKMQRRTSNSCGTAPELRNNSVLREQTADEGGFGHTSDGENHGAGARRNVMFAHRFNHFMKSAHDRFLQAGVHFFR